MATGIYQIRHLASDKRYIGSAAFGIGVKLRFRQHRNLLRQNKHYAVKLQRAWNKYGESAFMFEVLLYCAPENCLMYEQICLDYFEPEYNSAKDAKHPMKGRKHSQKSKDKIAKAHRGKQVSKETKAKLSKRYKELKQPPHTGYRHSITTKENIAEKLSKLASRGIIAGEKHHSAKLTVTQVQEIRQLAALGKTLRKLSDQFGVTKATAHKIIKRQIWKYVD
jgi:group I intron endonuclease